MICVWVWKPRDNKLNTRGNEDSTDFRLANILSLVLNWQTTRIAWIIFLLNFFSCFSIYPEINEQKSWKLVSMKYLEKQRLVNKNNSIDCVIRIATWLFLFNWSRFFIITIEISKVKKFLWKKYQSSTIFKLGQIKVEL